METVFIDTHVVIWLFLNDKNKFSSKAVALIEKSELVVPAIVITELGLLYEIKRINYTPQQILDSLQQTIGVKISHLSFEKVAFKSTEILWTRDPFDRLITATAMLDNAKLITKDQMILENYENAVW